MGTGRLRTSVLVGMSNVGYGEIDEKEAVCWFMVHSALYSTTFCSCNSLLFTVNLRIFEPN